MFERHKDHFDVKASDHEFFRPRWRRILLVVLLAVWCAVEWFFLRDELWAWLTTGIFAYAVWTFLVRFDETEPPKA